MWEITEIASTALFSRHVIQDFFLIQFLFIYSVIIFKVETQGFWQHIYHLFLIYYGDFWEVATGGFWKQSIICFYYIMGLLGSGNRGLRGKTKKKEKIPRSARRHQQHFPVL